MAEAGQPHDPIGDRFMRIFWRKPAPNLEERTRRRVVVHLVPYLFFLYILAYLDRVNVGVAKFGMNLSPEEGGLGFNNEIIGFGGGLFMWAYWVLEIPSTISVLKRGARWVFVRILVLWGICATLVAFIGMESFTQPFFGWLPDLGYKSGWLGDVTNYLNELPTNAKYQFYFFRFMLGFFEGGFFPTVIFYLSIWFRPQDRAKAIALFMSAIPLSSVIGTPLGGLLMKIELFDLEGWRWLFIVEGVLPIFAGITTLFMLPDNPRKAKWLSEEERTWLLSELEREHQGKAQAHGFAALKGHLPMVLLLTLVYFCQNMSSYGLSYFMPSIFAEAVGGNQTWALALTTILYTFAFIGMMVNGSHSDRTGERLLHVSIPLLCLGLAVLLTGLLFNFAVLPIISLILLVGFFHYAHLPSFWPIPTMFLGSVAAASSIGFINMVGNLGGYFGPKLVGQMGENASFSEALIKVIAPWPILASVIILGVGLFRKKVPADNVPIAKTVEGDADIVPNVPPPDAARKRRLETDPYVPPERPET